MQFDKARNPVSQIDAPLKLLSQDHQPLYIGNVTSIASSTKSKQILTLIFYVHKSYVFLLFGSCTQHFRGDAEAGRRVP